MTADVILLHGPPFSGRTLYYNEHLYNDFERVDLRAICKKNSELSIRQIIKSFIIVPLEKGKKIVIDDSFKTLKKRQSFTGLIKKKIPEVKYECYKFVAENGSNQLHWAKEFAIAEAVCNQQHDLVEELTKIDIDGWMHQVEPPQDIEQFSDIREISSTLKAQCNFQFEVPTLFMQWEGILKTSAEPELAEGVQQVIELWYKTYPCGRVLLIAAGYSSFMKYYTTSATVSERSSQMKKLMKQLTKQLPCPVYLLIVQQLITSDSYSIPPNPGCLAFLQRLHCIDLYHPGTMYLYHTNEHMKMAAQTGIKHIKASRVLTHVELVKSALATSQTKPPAMLQKMKVFPFSRSCLNKRPEIPFCSKILNAEDCFITHNISAGKTIYASVKNTEVLQRYQTEYEQNATPSGTNIPSRILKLYLDSSTLSLKTSQPVRHKQHRKLPEWMLSRRSEREGEGTSKQRTNDWSTKLSSESSVCGNTVYVMSADELIEAAKLILLEAGEPIPSDEEIQAHLNKDSCSEDDLEEDPVMKMASCQNELEISDELELKIDKPAPEGQNHSVHSNNITPTGSPAQKKFKANEQTDIITNSFVSETQRKNQSVNTGTITRTNCTILPNSLTSESNAKLDSSPGSVQSDSDNNLKDLEIGATGSMSHQQNEKSLKPSNNIDDDDDSMSILDGLI